MKKGKVRIILGCTLIMLQVLSIMGNAKIGISYALDFSNTYTLFYSVLYLFGSCLVGIIGIILLVSGLLAKHRPSKETTYPLNEKCHPVEPNVGLQKRNSSTSHALTYKFFLITISTLLALSLVGNAYLYKSNTALNLKMDTLNQSLDELKANQSTTQTDSTQDLTLLKQRLVICNPEEMVYHSEDCSLLFSDSVEHFLFKWGENSYFYLDAYATAQFEYSPCENCRPEAGLR